MKYDKIMAGNNLKSICRDFRADIDADEGYNG